MLLNTKILVCTGDVSFEIYAVNVSTLCLKSDLSQECIIFTNNDNNITTITLATAIIIIIIITIIIIYIALFLTGIPTVLYNCTVKNYTLNIK